MKIQMITLLLLLAFISPPSHALTQHEALTKFLRERTSRFNNKQEWSPPSIPYSSSFYGSQKGLKELDQITALPGLPPNVTFAQYSGYVTIDSNSGKALFYYFTEATEDPSCKPLLLWLNGGPGCSSLGYGAMMELGPFRVKSDNKTLYNNPYAWNQVANTLFLESPAGVGFSYSNTSSDYSATDNSTAQDSYTFLLNWFERFPEYKFRDFYIAGESYAGHYVPQLTDVILKNNNSNTSFINLKGVMVGNGIMNDQTDSCGYYDYLWSHALMSDEDYEEYRCNGSTDLSAPPTQSSDINEKDQHIDINYYNIYAPLCPSHPNPIWQASASSTSTDIVPTSGLDGFDPCSPSYVTSYLNTPRVQRALHANVTSLPYDWATCSNVLSYGRFVGTSMSPIYSRIMAAGLRILIYSGDVDAVVPVTGTRYGINAMNLTIETPWYPWMNSELDVGGYSVIYKGLTFATVRGAGHEVPSYQPARALTMAKYFLAGKPLPSQ